MSNKNAVVIFNGARQHSFSAQKDCLVTLNAGKNVVSVAKLERLTGKTDDAELNKAKSVSFIEMIETGEIEIVDDAAVEVAETTEDDNSIVKDTNKNTIKINIVDLGAKEAITVISAEADVDIVQGYLDAENASGDTRKTVVKACEDAITALAC